MDPDSAAWAWPIPAPDRPSVDAEIGALNCAARGLAMPLTRVSSRPAPREVPGRPVPAAGLLRPPRRRDCSRECAGRPGTTLLPPEAMRQGTDRVDIPGTSEGAHVECSVMAVKPGSGVTVAEL